MDETVTPRTDREDFQATRDPALMASADQGQVNLLSYRQLYELWERQQWQTQAIDFAQDREDWWGSRRRALPAHVRAQLVLHREQKVAEELGPIMRAAPTEEMKIFLCTQIADEARHVQFFNRFYEEVGVLESGDLHARLEETSAHLNRTSRRCSTRC